MVVRQLNDRNQITIPVRILSRIGVKAGSHLAIQEKNGTITIRPVTFTESGAEPSQVEWGKLKVFVDQQIAKGEYTEYRSPEAAKKHLRRLAARRGR